MAGGPERPRNQSPSFYVELKCQQQDCLDSTVTTGDESPLRRGADQDEEDVFIVRVRMETVEDERDPRALRGKVEHLPTHRSRYFRDFETLFEFLISKLWR